jgi:hypothetical protein
MQGLGPTMTAWGQRIGISIGMLDKLIRTTLGLKRGAWGGRPTCHPQMQPVARMVLDVSAVTVICGLGYGVWAQQSRNHGLIPSSGLSFL